MNMNAFQLGEQGSDEQVHQIWNCLRYSSHSMGRSCFLALLHVLQQGTTLPRVLLPPRDIGTM